MNTRMTRLTDARHGYPVLFDAWVPEQSTVTVQVEAWVPAGAPPSPHAQRGDTRMTKDERRLSARVRPDVEAAPWVIDAIQKLEAELDAADAEIARLRAVLADEIDTTEKLQARVQRLTDALDALVQDIEARSGNDSVTVIDDCYHEACAALAEGDAHP